METNFINLDADELNIIEALMFSYLTGKSFTSKRWSAQAQKELQLYVRGGKIFLQSCEDPAKPITTLSAQKLNDKYVVYEGNYEQYHNIIKSDIDKFNRLKEEIEPLYSQFKEYERLKIKIAGFDSDEEDF